MKIRVGYEISYDCPQPTPMILTLSVHPLYLSVACRREAGEVKDASQPDPPQGQ